jgi:hypothetical protein
MIPLSREVWQLPATWSLLSKTVALNFPDATNSLASTAHAKPAPAKPIFFFIIILFF